MDSKGWAKSEFDVVDLGDDRLNQRLMKISQTFLDSPESPINKACGDWGETKAAYRFFNNDNVDYQDIIQAHAKTTAARSKQEGVVLAIQDTTYWIAQLGGFLARKDDGDPGITHIWRGLQKLTDMTEGARLLQHTCG